MFQWFFQKHLMLYALVKEEMEECDLAFSTLQECSGRSALFFDVEDYTLIWPGVVVAVNEFAQAHQLAVHFTDEIWWVRKPDETWSFSPNMTFNFPALDGLRKVDVVDGAWKPFRWESCGSRIRCWTFGPGHGEFPQCHVAPRSVWS